MRHQVLRSRLSIVAALALLAAVHRASAGECFLDASRIATAKDLERRVQPPERKEVAIRFDAPWEGRECGYVTVLRDGDRFLMYYRGGGETTREVTCVATSKDGVSWERPLLRLYEFGGTNGNNIVWMPKEPSYAESHNFSPFLDSNPAATPDRRFKAVALRFFPDDKGERRRMLVALHSADGIKWERTGEGPIIREGGGFDSLNVPFYDKALNKYACYARVGIDGFRSIQRSVSADFTTWEPAVPLVFPEPPMTQFYTNAIQPLPGSDGMYIGMPMRFVPERKSIGAGKRSIDGTSDAVLISSRDGARWDYTLKEAFIRPGRDSNNWGNAHGNQTPATGILETAPGEWSIYWVENYGDVPRVRRGVYRPLGFVSMHADAREGEFTTTSFPAAGKGLRVNLATSAVGVLKAELVGADGEPIAGRSLAEADEIFGDEIDRPVTWGGTADLGVAPGTAIRIRFVLRDADLYSWRFAQ